MEENASRIRFPNAGKTCETFARFGRRFVSHFGSTADASKRIEEKKYAA